MKSVCFFLLMTLLNPSHRIYTQGTQFGDKLNKANVDSLIRLEGYYIKKIEKKKILDVEKNRQNRLAGKSFKISIDTKIEDFFFPVNASERNLDRVLKGLSHQDHNAIYLYCSNANYSIFNAQFLNETEKVSRDTCPGLKSIKYYILNKSDPYCYQVFYLTGNWIEGLATTSVQKNVFWDKLAYIKDTSSPVSVFLLNKVLTLREIQGGPLKLWKEVPGIFDN